MKRVLMGAGLLLTASLSFASGSRCVVLAMVSKDLQLVQEIDVFKDQPICYDPTEIKEIDDYLDRTNILTGDIRVADAVVAYIKTGKTVWSDGTAVKDTVNILIPIVKQGVAEGTALVKQNAQMISTVKTTMTGWKAYKSPWVIKAVTQSGTNLSTALTSANSDLEALNKFIAAK